MPRGYPQKEVEVKTEEFDHECYGSGVHIVTQPMHFHFKCVPLPDGRKGCFCPSCQTQFVLKK